MSEVKKPSWLTGVREPECCYYCGLKDDVVEASGIFHCPNHFCTGPGNFHWRSKNGIHDEKGSQSEDQRKHWANLCLEELKAAIERKEWDRAILLNLSLDKIQART